MKKRDLFAMPERDLKFNITVKFSLSIANLRNQARLYGSLEINCSISKFCSQKQETESFFPIGISDEGDGLVAV